MKHCGRRALSLLLSCALMAGLVPLRVKAAGEQTKSWLYGTTETVEGGYEVDGKYDLIKGVFLFPSMTPKADGSYADIPAEFYYSDGLFANDPYKYNEHLATASLTMAMSAFYANEGRTGSGYDAEYAIKSEHIAQYMKDIGCEPGKIYRNAFNFERPGTDSIGVTIAQKELKYADGESTGRYLVPIAIRGSNYEKEWASNVTIGMGDEDDRNKGEHLGFATAANTAFNEVQNYIERDAKLKQAVANGRVTFWISGFSRAGATTNLTARRLVDAYLYKGNAATGNKVFAYCNEAPQGGVDAAKTAGHDYNCIHSVINRGDLVPLVAPSFMGFKRYGVDHYIPGSPAGDDLIEHGDKTPSDNVEYVVGDKDYRDTRALMLEQLKSINSDVVFDDSFQLIGLDTRQTKAAGIGAAVAAASAWATSGLSLVVYGVGVGLSAYFQGKNAIIRTGDDTTNMADFLVEFFDNLGGWTKVNRAQFIGQEGSLGDVQTAARDGMSIKADVTPAQKAAVKESFAGLFRIKGDDGKWSNTINLATGAYDLLGTFYYAFGNWSKLGKSDKTYYKDKLVQWVDKSGCLSKLELTLAERDRLVKEDLPAVAELAMLYLSEDYNHNLHGTNGMTQIMSLLWNINNIGLNHYPEVTLAWLRAQDSWYEQDGNKPVSYVLPALTEADAPVVSMGDSPLVGVFVNVAATAADDEREAGYKNAASEAVPVEIDPIQLGKTPITIRAKAGLPLHSDAVAYSCVKLNEDGSIIGEGGWTGNQSSAGAVDDADPSTCTINNLSPGKWILTVDTVRTSKSASHEKQTVTYLYRLDVKGYSVTIKNGNSDGTDKTELYAPNSAVKLPEDVKSWTVSYDGSTEEPKHLEGNELYIDDSLPIDTKITVAPNTTPETEEQSSAAEPEPQVFGTNGFFASIYADAAPVELTIDELIGDQKLPEKVVRGGENVVLDWIVPDDTFSDYAEAGKEYRALVSFTGDQPDSVMINGWPAEKVYVIDDSAEPREAFISDPMVALDGRVVTAVAAPADLYMSQNDSIRDMLPKVLWVQYDNGDVGTVDVTWTVPSVSVGENKVTGRLDLKGAKSSIDVVSVTVHVDGPEPLDAPMASLPTGTYTGSQTVRLAMPTYRANYGALESSVTQTVSDGQVSIYYTTDGTDPTESSSRKLYSGPFTVRSTTTLLAYATMKDDSSMDDSKVAIWNYTISGNSGSGNSGSGNSGSGSGGSGSGNSGSGSSDSGSSSPSISGSASATKPATTPAAPSGGSSSSDSTVRMMPVTGTTASSATTSNADGSATTRTTETTTAPDGSKSETVAESTTKTTNNADGSVTEAVNSKSTETVTAANGSKTTFETSGTTETTTSSKTNADGSATETVRTSAKSTQTVSDSSGGGTVNETTSTSVTETTSVQNADGSTRSTAETRSSSTVAATVKDTDGETRSFTTVTDTTKSLETTTAADGKVGGSGRVDTTSTVTYADGSTMTEKTEGTIAVSTNEKGTVSEVTTATVTTTDDGGNVSRAERVTTESTTKDGTTGTTVDDGEGNTLNVTAIVGEKALENARRSGEPIDVPVTVQPGRSMVDAPLIDVKLPAQNNGLRKVSAMPEIEFQLRNSGFGTAVYQLTPGMTPQLVKESRIGSIIVPIDGNTKFLIADNTKSFADVGSHWAKDSITFVTSRRIFDGTGEGFDPEGTMTRAMVAQMLYNFDRDSAAAAGAVFSDVQAGDWYAPAVGWANANGIVTGQGSFFGASDAVTRQDLVTVLYRYARNAGYKAAGSAALDRYSDADSVAEYAKPAMQWAIGNGILNGINGTLSPTAAATRAQVAAIMQRFVQTSR